MNPKPDRYVREGLPVPPLRRSDVALLGFA